ncbi:GNAT family N-acetyltransferase [Microbacter sp. GSS18]|nr:GNAT family N-acetyltransferase [Microbacter sp. GSS18]
MLDTATGITIAPIPVPAAFETADLQAFGELARLWNAACRHDSGHSHFDTTAHEIVPAWTDRTNRLTVGFLALDGPQAIGAATATVPLEEGADTVEFDLFVDPARWDENVAGRLLAAVERVAAEHGRTTLQIYTLHRPDTAGARLPAPTGSGSIPAGDRQTRLMLDHGYGLQQVERNSTLDLAADAGRLSVLRDRAAAASAPSYRTVSWTGPTPAELKGGFAYALSRMSTDVPMGGLDITEEVWDAARVDRREARLAAARLTVGVTCAIHVPTGDVAAYTELAIGEDPGAATQQLGTLVLREHRGHRLGMLVKCENLLRWRSVAPRSPRVSTFNAEENRYMLDVNEAIGFVPASYAGAWQKRIDEG